MAGLGRAPQEYQSRLKQKENDAYASSGLDRWVGDRREERREKEREWSA
ncbi:MAG: hypothetical protein H6765_03945 [Candidatus Peribacteria bacterium]|nr:MAG: hypothetical protein H6765_03945 [Candidatus Peribacteria bacterium]